MGLNGPYVALLLSKICGLCGMTGVILQLPHYINIYYDALLFIAEFWRLTAKFLTNGPYVALLLSKICGLYGVTGVILQLPRYMEIHYRQPAYIASIIAGQTSMSRVISSILSNNTGVHIIWNMSAYNMYVCMSAYLSVCLAVCLAWWLSVCLDVYVYVRMYVYIFMCVCLFHCMYVTYVCMFVCMLVCLVCLYNICE